MIDRLAAARDSNFIICPRLARLCSCLVRVPLAAETDGDDLIEFARMRMGKKEKREAKKGSERRRKGNYEFNLRAGGKISAGIRHQKEIISALSHSKVLALLVHSQRGVFFFT
jgi:hypothetical protein